VPDADLPIGTTFWRVRAVGGSVDLPSATWQMFVGPTIATVAADTGNVAQLDVNGDGYADLAVGSPSGGGGTAGKVQVFLGGAGGINSPGATSQEVDAPDTTDASFGSHVAAAGDINGDGFGDLVVSNIGGTVYVYFGSINGLHPLVATAVQTIPTPTSAGTDSEFGSTIGCAGDVNGDGYADIFVAASSQTVGGLQDVGSVYVFLGSADGVQPTDASRVIEIDGIDAADSEFADGVNAADLNGDGYGDLIVASEFGGPNMEGRLLVYLGGADGLQPTAVDRVLNVLGTDGDQSLFGAVISTSDLNGDGYSDILVSEWGYNASAGRVRVFMGGSAGITPQVPASVFTIDAPDGAGVQFGVALSGAGDLDNDGYGDFIVSEPGAGSSSPGKVFVYYGAALSAGASYRTPAQAITGGDGNNVGYGLPAIGIGDSNGDGYCDVAVGASSANAGAGFVHVYLGGTGGLQPTTAGHFVTINGGAAGAGFGQALASRQPLFKPRACRRPSSRLRRHS
jgi:hypothetical protein